jgi:hypothetical protein
MKIDITSLLLVLLILCMIYYNRREGYDNVYEYREFWTEDIPESTKVYFNMLLDPIDIKKRVYIHSVFDNLPYEGDDKDKDSEVHILINGETWDKGNLGDYDVKLIMEETDIRNGVICHPLFIMDSYVYNYWPRYMSVRRLIKKKKFCIFVVSNSNSYDVKVRNKFFKKLSKYKKVDSGGSALNNMGMNVPRNDESKGDYSYYEFLSEYKFMICFENTSKPNYLTEKLANAYLGGTVPIYWGASKVREWLNPKSFLQLEETATEEEMDRLINKIKEIDNDDKLYDEIYREPLMYSIHEELDMNKVREKVHEIVVRSNNTRL